ncbi:MAG: hypothetical protein ACKV19_28550 [Verrucomicrobiales bacterium]
MVRSLEIDGTGERTVIGPVDTADARYVKDGPGDRLRMQFSVNMGLKEGGTSRPLVQVAPRATDAFVRVACPLGI